MSIVSRLYSTGEKRLFLSVLERKSPLYASTYDWDVVARGDSVLRLKSRRVSRHHVNVALHPKSLADAACKYVFLVQGILESCPLQL